MKKSETAGDGFQRLVEILWMLRGEGGCPWDREQDEKTILNYFLEEAYEAVEALVQGTPLALCEELGDVLMEVVFLARIFEEKGEFSIADALESINLKMVRRHPHVFSGEKLESSRRVLEEWQRRKTEEKKRESLLEGIPGSLPALLAAFSVGQRASTVGFDWKDTAGALGKLREEIAELEKDVRSGEEEKSAREIGDVLFAAANVARKLGVNPEIALRQANSRFVARFGFIEKKLREKGRRPEEATLEEMDALWEEAKRSGLEHEGGGGSRGRS